MRIAQSYYTSCRVGLSGRPGFQTNAATPGMGAGVLSTLERLGGYSPPSSAPSMPTPAQIDALPVSLIFDRLPGGEAAVGQSRYTAQDYSGRYGNYFVHFLVLAPEDFEMTDFTPISLWRSPLWAQTESATTELPALSRVEDSYELTSGDLAAMVREPAMLKRLGQLISAVERGLAGGPRVVIANTDDMVARWIALATKVLPLSVAWTISFTTYVRNPAGVNTLISGTTLDSDFGFTDFEIQHQFVVFDFLKDRFSPVELSPFSRAVMLAFDHFAQCDPFLFPEFLTRVSPAVRAEDMAVAFGTYALTRRLRCDVPASAICDWCKGCIAKLKPAELSLILLVLEDEAAASAEGLQSLASLLEAGVRAGVATDAVPVFAGLLLRVLGTVEVAWLQRMPALLQAGHARQLVRPARVPLAAFHDPARLLAVVAILEELGSLTGQAAELKDAGRTVLGASLHQPATLLSLAAMAQRPYGQALLGGVAEALQQRAHDAAYLAQLAPMFRAPETAAALKLLVKRTASADLACWSEAHRLRESRTPPTQIFDQLLSLQAEHLPKLDTAAFDRALRLAWPSGNMEAKARALLLDKYSDGPDRKLFAASGIPAAIAASIMQHTGPIPEVNWAQAAQLLESFSKSLGGLEPELRALLLTGGKRKQMSAKAQLAEAWKLAPSATGNVRKDLLDFAAKHLLNLEDDARHKTELVEALADYKAEFGDAYARALEANLGTAPLERFIAYTQIWLDASATREPEGGAAIPLALVHQHKTAPREQRDRVLKKLASDPEKLERWQAMTADESFLGKTMGWFRGKK